MQENDGSLAYYMYNGHGDVVGLLDLNGAIIASYEYGAFGDISEEDGSYDNPYKFAGEYLDSETGFYLMGARYYSPGMGRWITEDPYKGTIKDLTTLNYYMPFRNHPLKYIDPTGMFNEESKWYKPDKNYVPIGADTPSNWVWMNNLFQGTTFGQVYLDFFNDVLKLTEKFEELPPLIKIGVFVAMTKLDALLTTPSVEYLSFTDTMYKVSLVENVSRGSSYLGAQWFSQSALSYGSSFLSTEGTSKTVPQVVDSQVGRKLVDHAADYGLTKSKEGAVAYKQITQDVLQNAQTVKTGNWKTLGECEFWIKGNDVAIVKDGNWVSTFPLNKPGTVEYINSLPIKKVGE